MTRRAIKPIVAAIAAAVPSLTTKGRLLARTPLTRIIRGFYLENSSAAGRFYFWAFVQPLYVPASTITFAFGKRLGGGSHTWCADHTTSLIKAIRSEGERFITNKESPESFLAWLEGTGSNDANTIEAKAYSLVAGGRFTNALAPLDALIAMLDDRVLWQREKKVTLQTLKAFCSSDIHRAREMLDAGERATRAALGAPF